MLAKNAFFGFSAVWSLGGYRLLLLSLLPENNLENTFSETMKLMQIAITTPMLSAESEWCVSKLKRTEPFLRSTMGQNWLNALAMLSVEFIQKSPDLNDMVLDLLASQRGVDVSISLNEVT